MTTVTAAPIDALEPLAPPALPSSGPPAGDFDLLIALWQTALTTAPTGAAVPDAAGGIPPESPGTADVTTVSAPLTANASGRSTKLRGSVGPGPVESGGPRAVVEPIAEETRDDDENTRSLEAIAQPLAFAVVSPGPAMSSPPAAAPAPVELPRQEESATPVTRAATNVIEGAVSPSPDTGPWSGRVEVETGAPRTEARVEPVVLPSTLAPRALSTPPATPATEAPPVAAPGIAGAPVAAPAHETETGVARPPVPLARPEVPLSLASPTATPPSATASPVPDAQRPPLAAPTGPRSVAFSSQRDAGAAEDSTAAEATARASAGPLRRVPIVAGRDSAHVAFSPSSQDREGAAPDSARDVTTAGPAAAAASPPERITADVGERIRPEPARGVVDQIATPLREIRSPGRHEISVRLDPPELGAVRIDARLDGGRLHVVIRAEHAVTGDLLADRLPQLREALAQQGFTPGDLSVGLGFDASGRQFARDGAPTFTPSFDGIPPQPARAVPPPVRAAVVADGLDVWA
jgi:flagellar hook-length control protein FliK